MLNQWRAGRGRPSAAGIGGLVGSIEVGTIVYIQDGIGPMGAGRFWSPVYRAPWIVEAWANRTVGAGRRGADGKHESVTVAGGHLAHVRCLRTGRRAMVADWLLRASLGE